MKKVLKTALAALCVLSLSACKEEEKITDAEATVPLATMFFEYTVNDAYTETTLSDRSTFEDYCFLVVDMTVKNTTENTISMGDADFWIAWGEGEDDYDAPISAYGEDPVVSNEFESSYQLAPEEEKTGTLVFIVPDTKKDFILKTEDYYSTSESAEPVTGDIYKISFAIGADGRLVKPEQTSEE